MGDKEKTAYCGIYCPDCIHYRNRYSILAAELKKELERIEFACYASVESPFGSSYDGFDKFESILENLSNTRCNTVCRVGGGCSGIPCEIMKCCQSREIVGCWECSKLEQCEKFAFLEPRCGDMPKKNSRLIREQGIENWADDRECFYIWQKSRSASSER